MQSEKNNPTDRHYYWMKFSENFFSDENILFLETQENGTKYIIFWQKLLLRTLRAEHPGMLRFNEKIPYDDMLLATVTRTDIDTVRVAMKFFLELGMVEILDDKTIYIEAVQKLIGKECESAERVRLHRERKKQREIEFKNNSKLELELYKEKETDIQTEVTLQCNDFSQNGIQKDTVCLPACLLFNFSKENNLEIDTNERITNLERKLALRGASKEYLTYSWERTKEKSLQKPVGYFISSLEKERFLDDFKDGVPLQDVWGFREEEEVKKETCSICGKENRIVIWRPNVCIDCRDKTIMEREKQRAEAIF
jgi:predicted phage replisome organizer